MINQDYILLIFNCHKYRYKAEIQKKGGYKHYLKLYNFVIVS